MEKGAKVKKPSGRTSDNSEYATQRLLFKIEPNPNNIYQRNRTNFSHGDRKAVIKEGGLRKRGYIKKPVRGKPLISVITTVFNADDSIERTIRSVINQTYDNLEYVVIDGGSTDGTLEVIKKYDDVINFWISRKDRGIYDGMNGGVCLAEGEWINFMNAGDEFASSDVIKYLAGLIKTTRRSFIYSDTILHYGKYEKERTHSCMVNENMRRLIHQSCIYKKELHVIYGNYIVADGVTISDYIFFNQIPIREFHKSDRIISRFDKNENTSSGRRHFEQKLGVDLIFGNATSITSLLRIMNYTFENIYRSIKEYITR